MVLEHFNAIKLTDALALIDAFRWLTPKPHCLGASPFSQAPHPLVFALMTLFFETGFLIVP